MLQLRMVHRYNSILDMMPTLLGLMGLSIPSRVGGMDLSHAALGQPGKEPECAFLQGAGATANWDTGHEWRAVRSKRYTYGKFRIQRSGADQELLFDNEADPYQRTNLISDEQYQMVVQQYRTMLSAKMASVSDSFDASAVYRDRWTDGDRNILRGARG